MHKPWYRHFWVWFVLAPLIGTVLASVITLFLAGSPPDLVVDDFGPIAMAVERDQRLDRRAAQLALRATLEFGPRPDGAAGQPVSVRLSGAAPDSLTLELVHPTLGQRDQAVRLQRRDGRYAGAIARADTRLYARITDGAGEWRLTGVLGRDDQVLELAAGP